MKKIFIMYSYYGTNVIIKEMNNEQHAKNYANKLSNVRYIIIHTTTEQQEQDLQHYELRLRRDFIKHRYYNNNKSKITRY